MVAYMGRKSIVMTNEPGIAETILRSAIVTAEYFDHQQQYIWSSDCQSVKINSHCLGVEKGCRDSLRDQGSFSKDSQKNCKIQGCAPEPVTRVKPIDLLEVSPKQDN